MNIGVIGIGKLGLAFALLCAKRGYTVYGADANWDYVTSLRDKTYRTTEPYIEHWLQDCGNFHPMYDNDAVVSRCDIVFLFVPTPSLENGAYDHQYIERAIASADFTGKTIVIGCTTMPGYTQELIDRTGYNITYNPEFIAQGDIINGLLKADMILIGTHNESSVHALQGIYRTIMDKESVLNAMSPTAAEITKIAINCFLTMKIAYANMIGEITIESGQQEYVGRILDAIGSDSRIGNKYLNYGFGYGGPCLPRDMRALGIHADSVGVVKKIPLAIDIQNIAHANYLLYYYAQKNPDREVPFIFPQLSYKAGVGMTVESQQLRLARELVAAGYKVYTTDVMVQDTGIEYIENASQVKGYTIEL
jgi:UDPglucose 6-dehydrogenase